MRCLLKCAHLLHISLLVCFTKVIDVLVERIRHLKRVCCSATAIWLLALMKQQDAFFIINLSLPTRVMMLGNWGDLNITATWLSEMLRSDALLLADRQDA